MALGLYVCGDTITIADYFGICLVTLGEVVETANMIKGLHHNAYRCRDSEEPLAGTLEIKESKTGRETNALHTFYELDDGSYLAFFEVPDKTFEFADQHDYDLHIALEVTPETLQKMFEKGKASGIETRGISDHGFIDSIYFRDPNGYVIELTAKRENHGEAMNRENNGAREKLDAWQLSKAG